MQVSIVDKLFDAIDEKKCCGVVNIDPVFDRLPDQYRRDLDPVDAIERFSRGVVDAVVAHVPAVKFNVAYFERYGPSGIAAYRRLVGYAKERGLFAIGDIKRGDVGHTATQYAEAHQGSTAEIDAPPPDAITINGYFGWDGVEPFAVLLGDDRMLFVLVRTSNPSAATIQDLPLADGRKVHDAVGELVNQWSKDRASSSTQYGPIGAVVATRDAGDAGRLRKAMPNTIFLVPGYGAQGGRADDFKPYFDDKGLGALIAAGRSVIYAYEQPTSREQFGDDWKSAVSHAARNFAIDLRRIMPS